ncbi:hypothetical protein E6H27_04250 [Candidatus Bathyarchaeota archaeon]|nr:MAG: hypothetical protein E6H27_04250 [Candidatus Bathyarchaeota archaeon]TMI57471.1 MAG: hypothetical protein E6H14_07170 [Candidatus Bathyarchaeota archaeon]
MFITVMVIVVALVLVFSHVSSPTIPQKYPTYSVYIFTRNGNHTQFQVSYSVGSTTGMNQVESLSFDNKTALGNFVQLRDEDCISFIIENTTAEFRLRVDCDNVGVYVLTRNGNHTQYQTSYVNGATDMVQIEWLSFDNKTALGGLVHFSPKCVSTVAENTPLEFRIRVQC